MGSSCSSSSPSSSNSNHSQHPSQYQNQRGRSAQYQSSNQNKSSDPPQSSKQYRSGDMSESLQQPLQNGSADQSESLQQPLYNGSDDKSESLQQHIQNSSAGKSESLLKKKSNLFDFILNMVSYTYKNVSDYQDYNENFMGKALQLGHAYAILEVELNNDIQYILYEYGTDMISNSIQSKEAINQNKTLDVVDVKWGTKLLDVDKFSDQFAKEEQYRLLSHNCYHYVKQLANEFYTTKSILFLDSVLNLFKIQLS